MNDNKTTQIDLQRPKQKPRQHPKDKKRERPILTINPADHPGNNEELGFNRLIILD